MTDRTSAAVERLFGLMSRPAHDAPEEPPMDAIRSMIQELETDTPHLPLDPHAVGFEGWFDYWVPYDD